MGAPVEGWPYERVAAEYGVLDRFLPYAHYDRSWKRPPGTTEDGTERQRLLCTAIIENRGRIMPEDLARIWLRDCNEGHMRQTMEGFDSRLVRLLRAGVPPRRLGEYSGWRELVSVARSCHPLGIINAGDPEQAKQDCLDIGRMYFPEADVGLEWAGVVAGAIAHALLPEATVGSVIRTALGLASERVAKELQAGLTLTRGFRGALAMRQRFGERYRRQGVGYALSYADEIVAKAFAIFKVTKGDPHNAIVAAVNFGRDTDCLASIAGGLAGALSGARKVPAEWMKQLDKATAKNPYTVSKRTLAGTADGLARALRQETVHLRRRLRGLSGKG
jgi:ADP-ribosylglycohydrolase